MHLNPYGEYAVTLAADLANRHPTSLGELVERCVAAGIILDFPIAEKDLDETLDLLIEWSKIVDVTDEAARAELVNVMLEQASAYPRMTNHANDGWHLHYRDPQQSLAEVLKALFSVGTALHLVGRGMHRLGRCTLDECTNIYADTSRNGNQRYCSPTCANRDAVRRHRARK
ncbi:CGNR zinc finger domain-containing protein [Rhodococcus sp. IEGM 1409]|uniref:CGNR zinc finger domain-containing protein n=1 Tax=Rhodococcus sp. IEGM 1409 TaxID=3047082 RepID=UPI0024B6A970|nr:CGNR zinc finger domain-containing protein [Rhodococcus sp. IEGM 1409]MDI9901656.1 CGNR zinc finger domain-containing protein [Rhodococcus sp. IEGM 1409]